MYQILSSFYFIYHLFSIRSYIRTLLSLDEVPAKRSYTSFRSIFLKQYRILFLSWSKSFATHPFSYTLPFKIDQKSSIALNSGTFTEFSCFFTNLISLKFDFLFAFPQILYYKQYFWGLYQQ